MRRLIKENEDRKKRIEESMQTLIYIIETNKKSKLDKEGNIKKCPEGDTYLMFMAIGVNWNMSNHDVILRFHIVQDDFRDE